MTRLPALFVLGLSLVGCDQQRPPPEFEPEPAFDPPPETRLRAAAVLDDYRTLCDASEPFTAAKKYTRGATPTDLSRVAVFHKYVESYQPAWQHVTSEPLAAWAASDPADVQLVACVEISKRALRRSCPFGSGEYKLDLYDMAHTVRVVAAATGEVVLAQDFELTSSDPCPTFESFGSTNDYRGTDYKHKLLALLLPLQPEGVAVPPPSSYLDLRRACDGVAFPGTAAYDRTAAQKHPLHITYRADEGAPFTHENAPANLYGKVESLDDAAAYQLVACVTGKPEKKRKECRFDGGVVLELHEGTVEVAVHATATGELVEKRTFKANRGSCPFMFSFPANADRAVWLGQIERPYEKYLASLVGG